MKDIGVTVWKLNVIPDITATARGLMTSLKVADLSNGIRQVKGNRPSLSKLDKWTTILYIKFQWQMLHLANKVLIQNWIVMQLVSIRKKTLISISKVERIIEPILSEDRKYWKDKCTTLYFPFIGTLDKNIFCNMTTSSRGDNKRNFLRTSPRKGG